VTVIEVLICCGVPNFIKIGSHVWPPDASNCWIFNAALLGNGRCHGNYIMADMSGTWWDATTQVSSKSVDWEASYGISNIFQHGGRPPFWILKILIFDHVSVILVIICCRIPNFIKIGSRVSSSDAHDCRMFNAPLLYNGRCHGSRVMADMSGTWRDATTQVSSQSVHWLALWHFQYLPTWRPAAILNFKKFNIWSRNCHCGLNLLLWTKFYQNRFIGMSNICLGYPQWKARPLIKKALLRDGRAFFFNSSSSQHREKCVDKKASTCDANLARNCKKRNSWEYHHDKPDRSGYPERSGYPDLIACHIYVWLSRQLWV